jgi:AraC-like DNA-binding protein
MNYARIKFTSLLLILHLIGFGQNQIDIYPFTQAFKNYNNEIQIDSAFTELNLKNDNKDNLILIKIAYANAIDQMGNHSKSLAVMKTIQDDLNALDPIIQSEYYQTLGNISIRSQSPELAMTHFKQSIAILEKESNIPTEILQSKYMSLGTGFNALEDNISAMETFEKALSMETSGTNRNSLYLRLNMALTNSKLGNLTIAKSYFTESLHFIRLNKDVYAEIRTLGNLADIYVQQDSLEIAKNLFTEGKKLALAEGYILDLIRFEKSLSNLNVLLGNYQLAYNHLVASDSISYKYNSNEVSEKIVAIEMEHQLQTEKLQKEANEKLLLIEQNKKSMLIISSVILFILLLVVIWLLALSKKKNMILLQQNLDSIKNKNNSSKNVSNNLYTEIIEKLNFEMEENKAYADSALTLDSLAKKLQTNRSYLSEAINSFYELNFSKWINEIRIFHAKEMLASPKFDQFSIEGISSMVGFSSISAFNSNFKKITGLTPSFFRTNRKK